MKVGSLFAGIGGFDLGLERSGMTPVWSVEIEPWCQHILKKHWPGNPVYSDIRDVKGREVEPVDVLCGGFPCQDISNAGKREGIEGARSSLWKEYARLVDELRPRYVIVENVAVLRRRGLDVVLGDLSTLGYDAEWDCLRASDFGAPHRRDRLWLVAYPGGPRLEGLRAEGPARDRGRQGPVANTDGLARDARWPGHADQGARGRDADRSGVSSDHVADTDGIGRERRPRVFGPAGWVESEDCRAGLADEWATEPGVGRVAHGVPARVDRLRGLGNALVPQAAEWIGRRILAYEAALGPRTDAVPRVTA